jgi:DNA-binding SARP family transcriptional activator/uncharacterized protein HemY
VAVEFHILGCFEALLDGRRFDVGPARQRCVLGILLVQANSTVSTDQLINRLWGESPPLRSRTTLHTYLSRLRGVLAATDAVRLTRRPSGYQLTIDNMSVDLHRFRTLAVRARTAQRDDDALALFDESLQLWRDEAFADLDSPWLTKMRAAVAQERLAAELDRNDVALRLGKHAEYVTSMSNLAEANPLDERLAGQTLLALYRCGRQADALRRYQQIRRQLVDDLGADPSPELQRLHQQILKADPALRHTGVLRLGNASSTVVPRQLPAAPHRFTGRVRELAALTGTEQACGISVICGPSGIGKTWLALHWADQNLDRFQDGQLHVNLCGFDPTGAPVPPQAVLRGFLGALGVDAGTVPATLEDQAALFRSLVSGKRMLILLDNARDTDQVEPLLPGGDTCTVLITSRNQLTGLTTTYGARSVVLGTLTHEESRELLAHHLGVDRIAAEPEPLADILRWCAGLPLALGIVASRSALNRNCPLALLADELREAAERLDAFDAGDLTADLRTVFSWSYRALDATGATVFRLLGLAPGPDLSLHAAASLIAQPVSIARKLLRTLENIHLVEQYTPCRYRMHDLLRLYAAEQVAHETPLEDRSAALRRLVDFYLQVAHAGERLLAPHRRPIAIEPPQPGVLAESLSDRNAALVWFHTEHSLLLAAQRAAVEQGWHTAVWQLAWTMTIFHRLRGHRQDDFAAWQTAEAATRRTGDPTAQALVHRYLGRSCVEVGRPAEAVHHLQCALTLTEQADDIPAQATNHHTLAWIWEQCGDDRKALHHAEHALRLFQSTDNMADVATALNAVGWYQAKLGHYGQAFEYCEQALTLCRQHHNRDHEAHTLDSLGYISHHLQQYKQAQRYYREALARFQDLGDLFEQANTLVHIGETHLAQQQPGQARDAWQQALHLCQTQHRFQEAKGIQQKLTTIDEQATRLPDR